MITVVLIFAALLLTISIQAQAAEQGNRVVRYSIDVDGYSIGEAEYRLTKTKDMETFTAREDIDAFGSTYSMDSRFTLKKGQLETLSTTENEDGERRSSAAKIKDGSLTILEQNNGRETELGSVKLTDFDCAYEGLARYIASKKFPEKEIQIRILDVETGEVVPAKVVVKGSEELTFDSQTFTCRIVHFTADGLKSTMWVAKDKLGAFVVRETTSSELGETEQELTSYSIKLGQTK